MEQAYPRLQKEQLPRPSDAVALERSRHSLDNSSVLLVRPEASIRFAKHRDDGVVCLDAFLHDFGRTDDHEED